MEREAAGVPGRRRRFTTAGADWQLVLMLGALATVFVVPGLLLLGQGVTAALAEYAGTPGTVQVTACVPFEGKSRGWTCSGEFVADEGEFRISRVTIEPFVEQRPTAPVEARVVGPASDEAWIPSLVPLTAGGGGLAFLGLAAWIVLGVFRNDDAPEQRLSKRARRRLDRRREGGAGPPQVGNRARKRRRRRRVARPRPGA